MAFTAVPQWSETPATNTEIDGIPISQSTLIDQLDNIVQELMSQIAAWTGDDTIASATTTDLSTVPGQYVTISGTTTITALGTVKAGWLKFVRFAGALTLTHNATSLILPGSANITTAAGDGAVFVSLGSGNWACIAYQPAAGYARLNAAQSWTANQTFNDGVNSKVAVRTNLVPAMNTLTGTVQGLEIFNNNNVSASAVMAFHRGGEFANFFGLDLDNKMKIGGWSLGLNAYPIAVLGSTTYNVGDLTINGAVRGSGGTASAAALAPSLGDTDTGLYAISDGTMGVTCNSGLVGYFNTSGYTSVTTTSAATFGSVAAAKLLSIGQMDITRDGGTAIRASRFSSDGTVMSIHSGATQVGSISFSGTTTAYNTTSDERLKPEHTRVPLEDEIDIDAVWEALEVLAYSMINGGTLEPVDGRWHGMLAQKLHRVYPLAVTPGKGEPGEPDFEPWSIDYSKLVPLMIARQKQFERRTNERFAALGL